MIEFPQDYFDDEVRDGFYVNGLMKRCWAAQIEVLSDIAFICEKYNIKWYADCGTLLGAVRHGGFVPWDDDLDICMFRDDYMKFIAVAEKELKSIWKGYKLFNFRNGDYWEVISRVVDMHSLSFEEERTAKFHGFPLEVGVDIFPLDYLCIDRAEEEKRMTICNSIFSIADDERLKYPDKYINEMLAAIESATGRRFDMKQSLQMQLYTLGEEMFSLYERKQAKYAALMGYWLKDESHRYDLKWYEQTVMLPFENIKIPVPAGYDSALKTEYGDYMKIVRTGGAHNYPRYGEQIRQLNEELGDESPFCRKLPKKIAVEDDEKYMHVVQRDYGNGNPRTAVVNQIKELAGLLGEAHVEVRRLLENDDKNTTLSLLADCQDTAIYMGTFIEENYGEGFVTVKYLEDYCELLFQVSEESSGDYIIADNIYNTLNNGLEIIRRSIDEDIKVRKEVVFIPYKAKLWNYMECLWKEHDNDPYTDVYVIPAPYYRKSAIGQLEEERYDGNLFPDHLIITDYRSYDFKEHQPDDIYIQNPFDNDNFSITIHPYFYSSRLKKYTDELIYVQSFVSEEIEEGEERAYKAMDQYAVSPGVVYADRVFVQSEHMREMYVKKLIDFFGKDSKHVWESKLEAHPEIYCMADMRVSKNNIDMPDEWRNIIFKSDGSAKKVALYYIGVDGLIEHGDRMLEKIKLSLDVFKDNCDNIALILRSDPLIKEAVTVNDSKLYLRYSVIIDQYKQDGFGIYYDGDNMGMLLDVIDAYYGDVNKMIQKCRSRKIPVMIQNIDV